MALMDVGRSGRLLVMFRSKRLFWEAFGSLRNTTYMRKIFLKIRASRRDSRYNRLRACFR